MDPSFLYDIPIVGLVAQLVAWLADVIVVFAPSIIRASTPIALAALCGVMCERSGVVNIGIEGTMLVAAFVGWYAGVLLGPVLGTEALPLFNASPTLIAAVLLAIVAGMLVATLHAWLSISVKSDQIINGTIINIAAFGVTGYLVTLISSSSPQSAGSFRAFRPPAELADIPLVGWLINALVSQGPITLTLLVFVVGFQIWLFRSRWGLRTRAVGEHPRAAETVGVDVIRLRYRNVIVAGAIAALGGAFMSLEGTNSFQDGMTRGAGFIGLAAMIVGRWTPLGAFGAALLFSSTTVIGRAVRFSPPEGELGTFLGSLPGQVFDALPYIITIIVLAGFVGRSIPPAADGQPYEREAAH
jgi:general nucleoside transport system permease protein